MAKKLARRHSIRINAILNMLNSFLTMGFSLITYPYATRVLQVSNLGKVNYASSIASYFVLFAALGFSTYAIREASRIRDDKQKLRCFVNEIYTENFVTVIIAFILYIIVIFTVKRFQDYRMLLLINSLSIFSGWVSLSWINVVFEDYLIITIRSIILHLMLIVSMFIFVKKESDYYIYAAINVLSNTVISVANGIYIRKYVKPGFTRWAKFKVHIPPVLAFFSNTLAVSIYLNADVTMLGWIIGDTSVGLYSVAVRIYTAIRTVIAAVYNVAIPRMSRYAADLQLTNFRELLNKIVNVIILIALPTTVGLLELSDEIILLISGKNYINASSTLKILSIAFFFAVMGGVLAYCVSVPIKREKIVLKATMISAIENIGLNLLLIPAVGIDGAAITTLLAEATVFGILLFNLRDKINYFAWRSIGKNFIKCIIASSPLFLLKYAIDSFKMHYIIVILLYFFLSVVLYCLISVLLKNEIFSHFIREYNIKINKKFAKEKN